MRKKSKKMVQKIEGKEQGENEREREVGTITEESERGKGDWGRRGDWQCLLPVGGDKGLGKRRKKMLRQGTTA